MANPRQFDLEDIVNRPGTYFNPQTEVLIVVDDSPDVDTEIFNMEDFEGADWVLISDEVADRRDGPRRAHAGLPGAPRVRADRRPRRRRRDRRRRRERRARGRRARGAVGGAGGPRGRVPPRLDGATRPRSAAPSRAPRRPPADRARRRSARRSPGRCRRRRRRASSSSAAGAAARGGRAARSGGSATSVTWGAGWSLPSAPIQRTTSPPVYVCSALNVSFVPAGLSGGRATGRSPGTGRARSPCRSPREVIVESSSVSVSPSSVLTGSASFLRVALPPAGHGLVGGVGEARAASGPRSSGRPWRPPRWGRGRRGARSRRPAPRSGCSVTWAARRRAARARPRRPPRRWSCGSWSWLLVGWMEHHRTGTFSVVSYWSNSETRLVTCSRQSPPGTSWTVSTT